MNRTRLCGPYIAAIAGLNHNGQATGKLSYPCSKLVPSSNVGRKMVLKAEGWVSCIICCAQDTMGLQQQPGALMTKRLHETFTLMQPSGCNLPGTLLREKSEVFPDYHH